MVQPAGRGTASVEVEDNIRLSPLYVMQAGRSTMDNHYYVSCSDMHRDFSSFHYRNTYVHKHDPFVTNMMRIF